MLLINEYVREKIGGHALSMAVGKLEHLSVTKLMQRNYTEAVDTFNEPQSGEATSC